MPFYRGQNWDCEKIAKVTELVNDGIKIQIKAQWTRVHTLDHYTRATVLEMATMSINQLETRV